MRRRELQTIQLKLSELKEYEQAKMERLRKRQQGTTSERPENPPQAEAGAGDAQVLAEQAEGSADRQSKSTRCRP